MKTLYLLRHANAASPIGIKDELRPLSAKGLAETKRVGDHLTQAGIRPNLWLVSAAKRTEETCNRLLRTSGIQIESQLMQSLYLATAGEMIQQLNQASGNPESILLIGHNPGIEQLVKLLCAGKGDSSAMAKLNAGYPTATFSEIALDIENWAQLEIGKGTLKSVFIS